MAPVYLDNVLWSPDHDYSAQVNNFLGMVNNSVKELSQTIDYIQKVKQTQLTSSVAFNNVVETSFSTKSRMSHSLTARSPFLEQSAQQKTIESNNSAATPDPVRSLTANYELHLDHLSEIAFSRDSLSNQIEAKVLQEVIEFNGVFKTFQKSTSKTLNDYLDNYQKLYKVVSNRQNDYFTKSKNLEEFNENGADTNSPNTNTLRPTSTTTFHQRSFSSSSSMQGSPVHNNVINDNSQLSPFRQITKTLSNVMSRQNSDDEDSEYDEDEDDDDDDLAEDVEEDDEEFPKAFLDKLEYPFKFGSNTKFQNLEELQEFCKKLYNDSLVLKRNFDNNSKRSSFMIPFGSENNNNESSIFISNHELGDWLKLNRAKTETSLKLIETFGQDMVNQDFLKLSVFKNSIFNNILSTKFQITNEDQIIVYEFTKFFKFILNFSLEKYNIYKQQKIQNKLQNRLKRQELKSVKRERKNWEEKQHSRVSSLSYSNSETTKVPDYIEDLKKSEFSTPVNRSRTNTVVNSNNLPKSGSTNAITGYLSNQLKSLSIIGSPEANSKKKESLRMQLKNSENLFKSAVIDINNLKKNFEFGFSNLVINFENYERKKTYLVINSLNYLSFLMMKQSEYEFKKFSKLNQLISGSNNQKLIDMELQSFVENNSMYYYSPFTSVKFEKNNSLFSNTQLISQTSLFGSDVSLLPQYQTYDKLIQFSIPIIFGEFVDNLYNLFLTNYNNRFNNSEELKDISHDDESSTTVLELGNFARNAWSEPFNILKAYDLRQLMIDLYENSQELSIEEKKNELNSIGFGNGFKKNEFQLLVIKKTLKEIFDQSDLNGLISVLKLWLLELPDSLISFTVFEKLKNIYFRSVDELFNDNEEELKKSLNDQTANCEKLLNDQELRFSQVLKILTMIPRSNLASLYFFLEHINKVSFMGFNNYGNKEEIETFEMLQKKFINDLINPIPKDHSSFPLSHLILRSSTKSGSYFSPSVNQKSNSRPGNNLKITNLKLQFFYKTLMKDLLNDILLLKIKSLIIDRESNQQKLSKLKSIKEKESIKNISGSNSPVLSRNNVKVFGDTSSVNNKRISSSSTTTGSIQNPKVFEFKRSRAESINSNTSSTSQTPTIMVEGLALRSFGTKNRPASQDFKPTVNNTPEPTNNENLGSPVSTGTKRLAKRRSFGLLNSNSIKVVDDNVDQEQKC